MQRTSLPAEQGEIKYRPPIGHLSGKFTEENQESRPNDQPSRVHSEGPVFKFLTSGLSPLNTILGQFHSLHNHRTYHYQF